MPRGGEPTDVAGVTDHVRRDDRADAVHVGDGGVRRPLRGDDAPLELVEGLVMTANLRQELTGDAFAFRAQAVDGPDRAQLSGGPFRRQFRR